MTKALCQQSQTQSCFVTLHAVPSFTKRSIAPHVAPYVASGELRTMNPQAGRQPDPHQPSPDPQLFTWAELPPEPLNPLLTRQFIAGAQAMVSRIMLKQGCLVPEHAHPNEQISLILSGALEFTFPHRHDHRTRGPDRRYPGQRSALGARARRHREHRPLRPAA